MYVKLPFVLSWFQILIRRSSIFCISQIINLYRKDFLLRDLRQEFPKICDWLVFSADNDPDDLIKNLAASCANSMHELISYS